MDDFYVYALIDPTIDEIFYLGKGKKKRYLDHIKEVNELDKIHSKRKSGLNPNKVQRIKKIIDSGKELKYKFIAKNLSEESAYVLEEILIERFGRKLLKNGNLLNLEPGGKWTYPKVILEDDEKTSIKTVKSKFPELIEILKLYPHYATESQLKPWWINKIPKKSVLFQYSLDGKLMAVHSTYCFNSVTGMSWRLIDKCIKENLGFAYDFQWSRVHETEMEDKKNLSPENILELRNFTRWKITEVKDLEMVENYKKRNQEVNYE
jgi:hypothetical protein